MIDKLIEPVSNILDKFVADKDLKTKLSHELEKEIISLNRAQLEVNKVEAKHNSIFVAGWRPFIGWVCGLAFGWHFIGQPVALFVVALTGTQIPPLPEFDMGTLLTVLGGMLGIGGLRTYEKQKGLTK